MKCATPERLACVSAPPSSSNVTSSPVTVFKRVALEDVEINGTLVKEGDRVGMFYASGNFDEDVFDDPYSFTITREENPHLGFGAGMHYCLGASLARLEGTVAIHRIIERFPQLQDPAALAELRLEASVAVGAPQPPRLPEILQRAAAADTGVTGLGGRRLLR